MRVVLCLALACCFLGCEEQPKPEPSSMGPATKTEQATPPVGSALRTAMRERPKTIASAMATAVGMNAPPAPSGVPAPPDVAEAPKTAKRTKSGLAYVVVAKGKGTKKPAQEDRVKVHYTGWTKDGKMFDSSVASNEPVVFGVGQVIPGWTEALKLMVEGEKIRAWIPANLAYGDKPGFGPAGQLTFEIELLEILKTPKPPKAPADVRAAPKSAKKTDSGLAYRSLKKGKGTRHPTLTDRVAVNYTGWTTDGKMFDSSIPTGQPATFPLSQVIKGWGEGLQLMVEGESMRFWIPAELAYGDKPTRPGAPAGMLVFDVELLAIQGGAPSSGHMGHGH
ncbi:MAG: FKBP-type peptidyl-prolyl cis-trans isomerase [Polyangiaceae bacterium]